MPSPSLYPSLLGDSWGELAPPVQRLHGATGGGLGTLRVRRGTGALARLLGALLRLPAAGERVRVVLQVERGETCERWSRSFDAQPLRTTQWRRGDRLVEALGPVQCWFALRAIEGALVFEQVRATLGARGFAVALPTWCAPRIEGRAGHEGDAVRVDVRLYAPWVGMLVSYEGCVTPSEAL